MSAEDIAGTTAKLYLECVGRRKAGLSTDVLCTQPTRATDCGNCSVDRLRCRVYTESCDSRLMTTRVPHDGRWWGVM